MPKVSVIIPTYNRSTLVKEAVESVLSQTFQDFELIIIDDGSTDNTRDVIKEFGERVRYIYQNNNGRSAARNLGISKAKGKYIAFLDSDDLFLPQKLEIQVNALETNPKFGMAYSYALVIDEDGNETDVCWEGNLSGNIYPDMLFIKNNLITTPTVMVRTDIIKKVGGFNERMNVCEDLDLWRRISKISPVLHIHKHLSIIRQRFSETIYIPDYVEARRSYYIKALEEDPLGLKPIRRMLFSEMYYVYATWANNLGQKKLARELAFKSLYYEPLKIGERCYLFDNFVLNHLLSIYRKVKSIIR